MVKRVWKVVHPLLTLAAVGCCVYLLLRPTAPVLSGRVSAGEDHHLRRFLDVKRIGGDAELPADVHHCALACFLYTDGQLDQRLSADTFSPSAGSRVIPYFVMWGPTAKGVRGSTVNQWSAMSAADDIWAKLDGPLAQCFGPTTFGEVHGFRIIGFAASGECRPSQENKRNISSGDVETTIEIRRHVMMLGYKPFATEEEARKYVNGDGMDADFRK
jgi:hypothetical protein